MNGDNQITQYDRVYGSLLDVSIHTKPSTVKVITPITGRTETFIVQTLRHEDNGDYIFVECANESGLIRLALPPKVSSAIAAQRESLTKRRRSIASKTSMRNRIASGYKPTFAKKAKKKGGNEARHRSVIMDAGPRTRGVPAKCWYPSCSQRAV